MTDNLPINWQDELAKQAKEVAAVERPALSQISTKSGMMVYQGQVVPGNKLTCIVLSSAFENRWYDSRFDPNKRSSPKCFSLSLTGEEMVPSEASGARQADTCDRCDKFQWGSDPGGGKGKACKSVRRLGLIPRDVLEAGNALTCEVALLSVPVTSARLWANYVTGVSVQYSRPPWAVLTEISIQPDPKTQFKINFTTVGMIPDDALGDLYKRIDSVNKILLTPYDNAGEIGGSYPGEPAKARKF